MTLPRRRHASRASTRCAGLLALAAALALPAQAEEPARPAPRPSAPSAPQAGAATTRPRTLIADTRSVLRAEGDSTLTAADEESRVIDAINRKTGTWQSYLLYTSPDLPEKLFHPGFTITLGPPRKKQLELRARAAPDASEAEKVARPAGPLP